jgi:hypothetical protein
MSDVAKWMCIFFFVLIAFSSAMSILTRKNFILHHDEIILSSQRVCMIHVDPALLMSSCRQVTRYQVSHRRKQG